MGESKERRKSLEPRMERGSEGNLRIHLQNTRAICRNRSLITTTDSLKLYEDQIVFKHNILSEVDEAALLKRPLSLCFDLGSSGEDTNVTDTSSTISSSVSSSSSSSNNSKSECSGSSKGDFEPFLDDEPYRGNRSTSGSDDLDADYDRYSSISTDSSAKESVITVIPKKSCNCRLNDNAAVYSCDCDDLYKLNGNVPNIKQLSEQSYDLNSPDDLDLNKVYISDNDVTSINKGFECEIPPKEILEIMKLFNLNTAGMRLFEDHTRSLICMVKIFVNLSEPVRMGSPIHLHNASIISDKTLFPRGGFELVNIDRSTTCKEIIEHLFEKFHIQENYCNYALFEHTVKVTEKDYVKRLGYDFSILGHLINMVRIEKHNFATQFLSKRFVLQENEKTHINWSTFSISELSNFLRILDKEERERRQKIVDFYTELSSLIKCHMKMGLE